MLTPLIGGVVMRSILFIAVTALAGCSHTQSLRTDLSARPVSTGLEEAALVQNLMLAYKACSPLESCKEFKIENKSETIQPFVEAGMTLSDYYCDLYFRQTNTAARKRRFTRNATNDVGGVLSAILGLAKAGSGVTGGIAAGFSFADSGFRNYDESFMVDADLSKLRRLVLSAQDNMKKAIFGSPPRSYFAAESTIIRYAGLCSFLGMQDLLNDSVTEKTARIEAATSNPTQTPDSPTTDKTVTTGAVNGIAGSPKPKPAVTSTTNIGASGTTDSQAAAAATESLPVAPPPPPSPS